MAEPSDFCTQAVQGDSKGGALLAQVSLPSCLESIIGARTVTKITLGSTSGFGPVMPPFLHAAQIRGCNV